MGRADEFFRVRAGAVRGAGAPVIGTFKHAASEFDAAAAFRQIAPPFGGGSSSRHEITPFLTRLTLFSDMQYGFPRIVSLQELAGNLRRPGPGRFDADSRGQ